MSSVRESDRSIPLHSILDRNGISSYLAISQPSLSELSVPNGPAVHREKPSPSL